MIALLATLSERMSWEQKQLVGLAVIGIPLLIYMSKQVKAKNWLVAIAICAVMIYLARGVGHGGNLWFQTGNR